MVEKMNRTVILYLAKVVSDHQRNWGTWLRLPCDLMFDCKPVDDVSVEDYIAYHRKRMDDAHDKVRQNIQKASEDDI